MASSVVSTTELSRIPKQKRSREKFCAILEAAPKLIHEKGYEQVSMREIAREVGLPIASVYQYFPNKLSIVRQLWESYTSTLGELVTKELSTLTNRSRKSDFSHVIGNIIDYMVAHHSDHPEFLDIWRCVDGSPELRALNRDDTLMVAELIKRAAMRLNPDVDEEEVTCRAIIACEAASAMVKRTPELPTELQDKLITELKTVLVSALADVV